MFKDGHAFSAALAVIGDEVDGHFESRAANVVDGDGNTTGYRLSWHREDLSVIKEVIVSPDGSVAPAPLAPVVVDSVGIATVIQ
tara:strand:+ start:860 stop:1111 length:252 start_codon:yes stop_codon:yes gene_type:complete